MPAREESHTVARRKRAGPRLLVFWEGGAASHELRNEARLVVGRGEESDIRIPHGSVSRRHAILVGKDGAWTVEDLGSSNGTEVGGRKLAPGTPTPFGLGVVVACGDGRMLLDADREETQDATHPGLGVAMQQVDRLIDLVADSTLPVLLLGETGVGKGRLADQIHARSSRAKKPFVRLNCAAVPESLLESELFGHERGAFTGAVATKPGIFENADGGTVFLDEIGEVPRAIQAKLLHALEHNEVMRVGATKPRPIDVRFIAATNRDIEQIVEAGTFRRDLYFRLAGVPVRIPPLRERTEEIPAMVRAFIAESKKPASLTSEAMDRLLAHAWPGNVRELRNVVIRAALLAEGGPIRPEHLMLDGLAPPSIPPPAADRRLESAVRDAERARIVEALERFEGHQGKAAEYLGISRRTLTNKLNELGLPRPRK